jgi:hypothetical protein
MFTRRLRRLAAAMFHGITTKRTDSVSRCDDVVEVILVAIIESIPKFDVVSGN